MLPQKPCQQRAKCQTDAKGGAQQAEGLGAFCAIEYLSQAGGSPGKRRCGGNTLQRTDQIKGDDVLHHQHSQ
ncbi:hypothetical protein D3C78_1519010 [compost metagenome]